MKWRRGGFADLAAERRGEVEAHMCGGFADLAAERGGEPASPLAPGRAVRAAGETDAFATPSPKTPVVARKG